MIREAEYLDSLKRVTAVASYALQQLTRLEEPKLDHDAALDRIRLEFPDVLYAQQLIADATPHATDSTRNGQQYPVTERSFAGASGRGRTEYQGGRP